MSAALTIGGGSIANASVEQSQSIPGVSLIFPHPDTGEMLRSFHRVEMVESSQYAIGDGIFHTSQLKFILSDETPLDIWTFEAFINGRHKASLVLERRDPDTGDLVDWLVPPSQFEQMRLIPYVYRHIDENPVKRLWFKLKGLDDLYPGYCIKDIDETSDMLDQIKLFLTDADYDQRAIPATNPEFLRMGIVSQSNKIHRLDKTGYYRARPIS